MLGLNGYRGKLGEINKNDMIKSKTRGRMARIGFLNTVSEC